MPLSDTPCSRPMPPRRRKKTNNTGERYTLSNSTSGGSPLSDQATSVFKRQKTLTSPTDSVCEKEIRRILDFDSEKNESWYKGDYSDSEGKDLTEEVTSPAELVKVNKTELVKVNMNGEGDNSASAPKQSAVTLEDIMGKLCSNEATLESIKAGMEELKSDVFSLRVENDNLRKEVESEKKKRERIEEQLTEVRHSASVALQKTNEVDQYVRRNNLRIYGVPEPDVKGGGGDGKEEDVEQTILDLFNRRMEMKVGPEDLEAAHRVGRRQQKGDNDKEAPPRVVIVRFVNRKTRDSVIHSRKKLKASPFVIVEDLTDHNYKLLCKVRDDELCDRAWTTNGKVLMKTISGFIVRVQTLADLMDKDKRKLWGRKNNQGVGPSARGGRHDGQFGNGDRGGGGRGGRRGAKH